MARAIWDGTVIAESDEYETVEGNVYFPPAALRQEFFRPSEHTSVCHWKGKASYLTVVVDGKENKDAAWVYKAPSEAASRIKDHVAFWRGVVVER